MNKNNREIEGVLTGLFLVTVGIILMISPWLFTLDLMQYGFAIISFGLFIVILGLITTVLFTQRYLSLASILSGKNLIAKWTYNQTKFIRNQKETLKAEKNENFIKLIIIWGFFMFFTLLFTIIGFIEGEGDNMGLFVIIMASILLFITFFALVMPYVHHIRSKKTSPVAYFSTIGFYYAGEFFNWNTPLASLESISISGNKKFIIINVKSFAIMGYFLYKRYSYQIPIPKNKIKKAETIVKKLSKT